MFLIDSCVLLDVLGGGSEWRDWSLNALDQAHAAGPMLVNHIIFAELHGGLRPAEAVARHLRDLDIRLVGLDEESARRAGVAHFAYRRRSAERRAILADFLIGAHAATMGAKLVTRDRGRFPSYFPELTLITPEGPHP